MTYVLLFLMFIAGGLLGYFIGWINGNRHGYNWGVEVGIAKGELKAWQDAIRKPK